MPRLLSELKRKRDQACERLWRQLRDKQLCGYDFIRDHAIGPYVVDFFCPAISLAVEIATGHENGERMSARNERRRHNLEAIGITVQTFDDDLVLGDIHSVLRTLSSHLG